MLSFPHEMSWMRFGTELSQFLRFSYLLLYISEQPILSFSFLPTILMRSMQMKKTAPLSANSSFKNVLLGRRGTNSFKVAPFCSC